MRIKINMLEALAAKALQAGDIVYLEKNGKIDSKSIWKLGARRKSVANGIGDPKVDRIKIEGFTASPCYVHYLAEGTTSGMWSSKRHVLSDTALKKYKRTDLKGLVKAALDGKITGVRLKADVQAKLEKRLVALKEKAKAEKAAATPSVGAPKTAAPSGMAWFVVDTSTRPATPVLGPYPSKVVAESRKGVRPNRAVKRLPADAFKPKSRIVQKSSAAEEARDFWNANITPALNAISTLLKKAKAPTEEIIPIQTGLNTAGRLLFKEEYPTLATLKKAAAILDRVSREKVSARKVAVRTEMQKAGVEAFRSVVSNPYLLNHTFSARHDDDMIHYTMIIKDSADHLALAYWLFSENRVQAKKASYMDTASRDHLPDSVAEFIYENLR